VHDKSHGKSINHPEDDYKSIQLGSVIILDARAMLKVQSNSRVTFEKILELICT